MKPEHRLNIWRFIVAILALIAAFMLIDEDQVAKALLLSKDQMGDARVLLARLVLVSRIACATSFILFAWALFIFLKPLFQEPATQTQTNKAVFPQAVCMSEALDHLKRSPAVTSLKIWGYSLNWASQISNYLSENQRQNLHVALFVPAESIIGVKFKDKNAEERKAVQRLRLEEWRQLAQRQMVASVDVYVHESIPNDMGIILDNAILYYGSYDWESRDNELWHRRQPNDARVFIRCDHESPFLLDSMAKRLNCRQYDSKKT